MGQSAHVILDNNAIAAAAGAATAISDGLTRTMNIVITVLWLPMLLVLASYSGRHRKLNKRVSLFRAFRQVFSELQLTCHRLSAAVSAIAVTLTACPGSTDGESITRTPLDVLELAVVFVPAGRLHSQILTFPRPESQTSKSEISNRWFRSGRGHKVDVCCRMRIRYSYG